MPLVPRHSNRIGAGNQRHVHMPSAAQFKRTLLARRFPGLRALSDADIKSLIAADRKASGRKLEAEQKLYPKTQFLPPAPKREQPSDAPAPFVPVSRTQAKDDISLQPSDVSLRQGLPPALPCPPPPPRPMQPTAPLSVHTPTR